MLIGSVVLIVCVDIMCDVDSIYGVDCTGNM